MDLFVNDANDIASGNMRSKAQESANRAVDEHNQIIASQLTQIHKDLQSQQTQLSENEALQEVQSGIGGMLGAHAFSSALGEYKQYRDNLQTKASALADLKRQGGDNGGDLRMGQGDDGQVSVVAPDNSTETPPSSATPEGTSATGTSETAPTSEEHNDITMGDEVEGSSDSMFTKGLKGLTGLSDEGIENISKGATAAGAVATGGLDIYKDIKAGGIAGDNGWEKAGNVLQIGGAVADIVGVAFPPAAVVGGIIDLIGGGLDAIGEAVEGTEKKSEVKQQAQEQAQDVSAQVQAPIPVSAAPQVAQSQTA